MVKTKDDFLQEINALLEGLESIGDDELLKKIRIACIKLIREIVDSHFTVNANDLWQRKCLCRAIKMLEMNFLEACLHKLQNAFANSPDLSKEEEMIKKLTKEELIERLEKAIYMTAQR